MSISASNNEVTLKFVLGVIQREMARSSIDDMRLTIGLPL